jgi:hypothetical protein
LLNLVRRHLPKESVVAIRKLAAKQYPELSKPIQEIKNRLKPLGITTLALGSANN